MTYLPNALNQYDTYTYNLKLYMVHPHDLPLLDKAIDNGRAKLIADNARVAKFNISDVEQIFTVGHDSVREGLGNKFNLRISEPNGVTLLETLAGVSRSLGINNHISARYILVIDFHGRMPNGAAKKHNQSFYYPLIITRFDFNVDEGGTNYNIDMVENSFSGYNYTNVIINEQITVNAKTVGDFVSEFERKYNQSIINAWATNRSSGMFHDIYKFEFDESAQAWANWRFQVLDEELSIGAAEFVGFPGTDPSLQVTANNGTNIPTLFGQVLQLTAEYKKILMRQRNNLRSSYARREPSEEVTATLDGLPTFFKVITNVEYGKYDLIANDYQKIITYKLKAYTVTDEILDATAYQKSITNKSVQTSRVENLIANNFLRKRYDYIYTGNNTEVMEFDMQFDYAYYYVVPYGDGYFGDPDVQSPQLGADSEEIMGRLRKVTEAKKRLAQASKSVSNISVSSSADAISVGSAQNVFKDALEDFNTLANSFIDFLDRNYELSTGDVDYYMRFIADNISDQDTSTSDNDTKSGALKFGAVKANLENAADLVRIELGIRGDPYWMGKPNSLYNVQSNVDELVDFEAGAPSFFLSVNMPINDEDSAGQRKPRPDYHLSGVYTVRNVINRFQNGTFTQYLNAVRDLATNTATVYDVLAGDTSVARASGSTKFENTGRNIAQEIENAYRGLVQ